VVAASEAFLSEISGAQPWPNQRHMNMESIYEFGSRAGFWRLWRLFAGRKIPVTVYGVAHALMRSPDAVAAMREAGRITARALDAVRRAVRPGVTTAELDAIAEDVIRSHGATPAFLHYPNPSYSNAPYPATITADQARAETFVMITHWRTLAHWQRAAALAQPPGPRSPAP
jgi:peptidoglycan/xylan/chitin deacetylase (PgdA/CDA1 family)